MPEWMKKKDSWVALTAVALFGLAWEEFHLIQKPETWLCPWMKMFLAIVPNFIASLVAILITYAILRLTARDHYIKTMKGIREAVQHLPSELRLRPEQVQALMTGMVPIMCDVYNNGNPFTSGKADKEKVYQTTCLSCGTACIVKGGHCAVKCSDIPESWAGQEFTEITPPPQNATRNS